MAVYKRGDIWWYDFTVNGERYRASTQQRSKTAAKKVEDRERERAKLGEVRAVLTLHQAADRWFSARAQDRKSAVTTAQRIVIMLRCVGAAKLVSEIDTPDIEEAMQRRRVEPTRQGRLPTNATVNRDLIDSTLRPVLRYARKVLKQPVRDIEWADLRLPEPKGRVRSFTPAEMTDWASFLPDHHRAVRDFMSRYGVRLREAFFPLSAINTETWEITVRGPRRKNGLPHVVPLLDDDARDIAARMSRAGAAGLDTVWYWDDRGTLKPITPRGFQSASKAALVKAGIGDARPAHDLRHHAGTAAMRASGNLKVVKELLGHENIQSTDRYAHADRSDVLKALRHAHVTEDGNIAESPVKSNAGTGT